MTSGHCQYGQGMSTRAGEWLTCGLEAVVWIAFTPLSCKGGQNPVDLLRFRPEYQAQTHLTKAGDNALVLEVVQLHVGPKRALPYGAFFAHPRGGLGFLDKVFVAVVYPLRLLSVVLSGIPHDEHRLVDRPGR
jgi:hypothetical protein